MLLSGNCSYLEHMLMPMVGESITYTCVSSTNGDKNLFAITGAQMSHGCSEAYGISAIL